MRERKIEITLNKENLVAYHVKNETLCKIQKMMNEMLETVNYDLVHLTSINLKSSYVCDCVDNVYESITAIRNLQLASKCQFHTMCKFVSVAIEFEDAFRLECSECKFQYITLNDN